MKTGFMVTLCILGALLTSPVSHAAGLRITTDGTIAIPVGSQHSQIRSQIRRTGQGAASNATPAEAFACDTYPTLSGNADVQIERGIVTVVSTESSSFSTNAGIAVGATERSLKTAYGTRLQQHYNDSSGDAFFVLRSTSGRAMKFELLERRVTRISAGNFSAIMASEGCY